MKRQSKTMNNSGQKTSCRIVFFGNEQIATGTHTDAPILRSLIADGHSVVAVVLSDAGTKSRNKQVPAVITVAAEHGIPVFQPSSLREIESQLVELKPDVGVLAAYGRLVPRSVIESFPHGIVNIHPSLLPKHRGSIPVEAALLAGEAETGVSLMELAPEMDTGPIYAQSAVAITDQDKQTLSDELAEIGAQMLHELLPGICSGAVVAVPQDHSAATYDARITKEVREMQLGKPALQLANEVKAYAGWPGCVLQIAGKECTIIHAHVASNSVENVDEKTIFVANKQLCLQASDGILVIDSLKPAGKTTMPASAFIAGHKQLL